MTNTFRGVLLLTRLVSGVKPGSEFAHALDRVKIHNDAGLVHLSLDLSKTQVEQVLDAMGGSGSNYSMFF